MSDLYDILAIDHLSILEVENQRLRELCKELATVIQEAHHELYMAGHVCDRDAIQSAMWGLGIDLPELDP